MAIFGTVTLLLWFPPLVILPPHAHSKGNEPQAGSTSWIKGKLVVLHMDLGSHHTALYAVSASSAFSVYN